MKTKKMTWHDVICSDCADLERWHCNRILNQRNAILIYKIGRVRYRSDTKSKTSARELHGENWILVHTMKYKVCTPDQDFPD